MKYIVQDITTVEPPGIIAHGVNCQNIMGSGVAKALFQKWPLVRGVTLAGVTEPEDARVSKTHGSMSSRLTARTIGQLDLLAGLFVIGIALT